MKLSTKKSIKVFLLFLVAVAVYGGLVALANHWYRSSGHTSRSFTVILIGCTVYVYYRAWRWLCRKLDLLESGK